VRAFKKSAAALVLLVWFGLSAAVVVWCVSYLFWGEYEPVTMTATTGDETCVGTWCTDGSWMRTPATHQTETGTEPITALGDYPADMTLDLLVGPLPGLALPSRFEALFPLIVATPALLGSTVVNVVFWKDLLDR
jgi:hypothetical protein